MRAKNVISVLMMVTGTLVFSNVSGGCADTEFSPGDAAVDQLPDGGGPDRYIWPDIGPFPDGVPVMFPEAMYAHSQEELFVLDPDTLKLSLVGAFGNDAPEINDLAVTPDGEIYGISVNDLFRIDRDTANATWIAAVEGTANVALTFEVGGTLLASDKAGALRRIDPATGEVTELGMYGNGFGSSGDLVAIQDGTLFGVNDVGDGKKDNNDLITVDPQSGTAQTVGPIGYAQVWGLAYWGGTIYGLTKAGELLGINPDTGEGTLISTFAHEFWGAAVTPLAPIE